MSNEKDRIEGAADQAKGRVKEAAGDLTGDSKQQGDGKVDQVKGKVREGAADARDKASDLLNRDDDK